MLPSRAMVRLAAVVLLLLAACGRLGFDSGTGKDAPGTDAADALATDADPVVAAGLRLWMEFEPGFERRETMSGQLAACAQCPGAIAGPRGGAVKFTPPACLTIPSVAAFQAQELTLALWFRKSTNVRGTAVGKGFEADTQLTNSFELWTRDSVVGQFTSTPGGGTQQNLNLDLSPAATWHHFAGTFRANEMRAYLDGVQRHMTSSFSGPIPYDDEPVRIGCDRDGGDIVEYFDGELDDVRFYDRVLTADEIALLAAP